MEKVKHTSLFHCKYNFENVSHLKSPIFKEYLRMEKMLSITLHEKSRF